MSEKKHSKRKVMLIVFAVIVGILIILSFTVIGTGAVENGMAAVKPHPAPPPPTISFAPPPSDKSSGDDTPSIDSTEGDVEDDDTPAPPDQVAAAPSGVPTPTVTQKVTTTTTPTVTVPQVVTTPPLPKPGVVTTTQTPSPPPPPPFDACRNKDGIQPSVPLGKVRTDEGDCVDPPENNVGLCQGGQFILTPVSKVADGLKAGQKLGPWVSDGIGLVCWISDLVTYHANPAEYFFTGYYVGDGGARDGLFKCATPYEDWLLYPYYAKKNQPLNGQVFPSQKCP